MHGLAGRGNTAKATYSSLSAPPTTHNPKSYVIPLRRNRFSPLLQPEAKEPRGLFPTPYRTYQAELTRGGGYKPGE
ncbi:hypothetical protein E2320_008919 [Naja naja]|nr:hypothetical protein E2320_008919 [Naja naja]